MAQSDRVAVITGAAKGIGAACARRFTAEGVNTVIADIDAEAGARLADELGARARFIACDVADPDQVSALFTQTNEAFGAVDILINNAAIIAGGGILDLEPEDFDRVMGVNLRGAFLAARAAARMMTDRIETDAIAAEAARRRFAIVNMSSINAQVSIGDQLAYSASKGALNQMTRAMALTLAPYGVRVNAIGPGSIDTDILKAVADDKAAMERILSRTPLGALGDPSEIAALAWFLASGEASYITGECVYADGGRLALNYVMKRD